jgi:cytochrome o ubiquinol oxidase subunit 2
MNILKTRLGTPGTRTLLFILLLFPVLLLSGCVDSGYSFMAPDGPIAKAQKDHFWQVVMISMVVVLPVLIGVPLLVWRYRHSNNDASYHPHWDFNHSLEWTMWIVPAIIVVVLSIMLWNNTQKLDPYRPIAADKIPLEVEVVGFDWKWLFIYPDYHVATVGELVFPQDRPVTMKLTTDTVMQSFTIPALVGQVYAMPGMVTQLNLASDKLGNFDGKNTQYNGPGFDKQHFVARAVSDEDFNNWIRGVQTHGASLNSLAYQKLATSTTPATVHEQFANAAMPAKVTWFNDVASGFFHRIVMRYMNGKPVPAAEQPGSVAYNARHGVILQDE